MKVLGFDKKLSEVKAASRWQRRLALQLVAQLPDDRKDAEAVLAYALELVRVMEDN